MEQVPESGAGRARALLRRRRANVQGGRQHRHEVKVTPEEEAQLVRLAELHRVTVPRLLVESALSRDRSETPTERRDALAEMFRAIRLLSSIANNVNQIAKATNATGEVHDELSATLAAARRTAVRIDDALDGIAT
ncbi:MAG: MobC family plasmid mobilization relaxosome protein [Intrasporangium sp.]|uniref:plasmid mobilization protein n=1 Tax=Intrasporangium sp. TaxID=1925024 RepID=UPI002649D96C|nr:plasmid mobilization relaxosome protein MobC [Intrasporangium sp.]MDN5797514.1 MobC family plasmid mobilization relaxosome protein [Intrasporangium sp.]